MKENWPNFFTVGVPKAGTTSLFAFFRNHPDIYTAAIKEPNYFNRVSLPDDALIKPIRDRQYYLQLYEGVTVEKVICDMSISLFEDPSACQLILDVSPDSKILISLRDQVERMFSLFLMLKRNGRLSGTFSEEIAKGQDEDYSIPGQPGMKLKKRLYADNLSKWMDHFPQENIKVILFEDFITDQIGVTNSIYEFLGISSGETTESSLGAHNSYGEPRNIISRFILKNIRSKKLFKLFPFEFRKYVRDHILLQKAEKPKMLDEDRKKLQEYFTEDTIAVENILGRKVPWNNFTKSIQE
ncbi:MAG: sulfotransferase [Bacteroidetes bacterium]|nr:sulfotransferase [Bacteroidota bacterium]